MQMGNPLIADGIQEPRARELRTRSARRQKDLLVTRDQSVLSGLKGEIARLRRAKRKDAGSQAFEAGPF